MRVCQSAASRYPRRRPIFAALACAWLLPASSAASLLNQNFQGVGINLLFAHAGEFQQTGRTIYQALFYHCNYSRRRSEEHTSELQSQSNLVCRLLLEKKKNNVT